MLRKNLRCLHSPFHVSYPCAIKQTRVNEPTSHLIYATQELAVSPFSIPRLIAQSFQSRQANWRQRSGVCQSRISESCVSVSAAGAPGEEAGGSQSCMMGQGRSELGEAMQPVTGAGAGTLEEWATLREALSRSRSSQSQVQERAPLKSGQPSERQ